MTKALEPSQIEALLKSAHGPKPEHSPASQKVVSWNLRGTNQLAGEQLVAVTTLQEAFARRLSSSLGARLRVGFELTLVSVEQMAYKDFLGRAPDLTYFATMHVMPIDARAALQLDIGLAYPIIDLMLGGLTPEATEPRDLTEIEELVLETVFRLIVQDLHSSWAPVLDLDFQFEQRQRTVQMQSTMLPGEKVLSLSFAAHLAEFSGNLRVVFPAVIANTLLRRLSAQWSYSERIPSRHIRRQLHERMLDGRFLVDLSLPISGLPVWQLTNLAPGHVISLPQRVHEPIHLNVAGKPMFLAHPAQHGTNRAARIVKRLSLVPPGTKKN